MLFLWAFLLLVLCRQLSGEHILLHATIFLCKESYYRKKWKKCFPRKVNKVIEAELCASWLISFEEIWREGEGERNKGHQVRRKFMDVVRHNTVGACFMFIWNFTSLSMHNECMQMAYENKNYLENEPPRKSSVTN